MIKFYSKFISVIHIIMKWTFENFKPKLQNLTPLKLFADLNRSSAMFFMKWAWSSKDCVGTAADRGTCCAQLRASAMRRTFLASGT